MTIARRLRVEGVVQGVFFRDWTVRAARELGVAGWVRNLADGAVEVTAEGEAARVEELVARLHQGPSGARVDRVTVEEAEPAGLTDFRRRPTV